MNGTFTVEQEHALGAIVREAMEEADDCRVERLEEAIFGNGGEGLKSRVKAMETEVNATGVVSGFVPGAEPVLLVDDREVSPGEIKEVRMAAESV